MRSGTCIRRYSTCQGFISQTTSNSFLLYYGGGYSDIKRWQSSWRSAFSAFEDPETWIVGVPEIAGGVASPQIKTFPKHTTYSYRTVFISRKGNEYFRKVHARQNEILDEHYAALKANPAPNAVCLMLMNFLDDAYHLAFQRDQSICCDELRKLAFFWSAVQ